MKPINYEKAILFLLGEKGFYVLEKLIEFGYANYIGKIIVGKDKGVDNDFYSEIIRLSNKQNIVWQNRNDYLGLANNEIAFAISWKWIIITKNNPIVVLHDSILPKYRGFNPLVTSLINGDREIGVTAILASEIVDEGPILSQKKIIIDYPIRINEAIEKIKVIYSEIICDLFNLLFVLKQDLNGKVQDDSGASFSLWRDEQDYFIDWSKSAEEIQRFIYAVGAPYGGAKIKINSQIIRVNEAEVLPDLNIINRTPGKLISVGVSRKDASVVCKKGILKISKCITLDGNIYEFQKLRTRLDSF